MNDLIEKALLGAGADLVGFADISEASLGQEIAHLEKAVSIGVCRKLNEDTIHLLTKLQKKAARILKQQGYRYLIIPPVHDGRKKPFVSKLYPLFTHRIAATSAGLGWIGRNGLLINPEYGPRVSFSTVLTDAPLRASRPVSTCGCGECSLCVEYCPTHAICGNDWSRDNPFVELIDSQKCSSYKKKAKNVEGKPNCGLCIHICPYGRKQSGRQSAVNE